MKGIFRTKLQNEIENRKYDPEYIKLKMLSEMKLLPDEGEQFEFRGGLGNKILKQIKNDDGKYYERNSPNEEWKPYDLWGMYERVKEVLNIKI